MESENPAPQGPANSPSAGPYPRLPYGGASLQSPWDPAASDDGWETVRKYLLIGSLTATAIDTLVRGRGPGGLLNGAVAALDAVANSRQSVDNTRFNLAVTAFFAPVVAAAGIVLAIQIGRKIAPLMDQQQR